MLKKNHKNWKKYVVMIMVLTIIATSINFDFMNHKVYAATLSTPNITSPRNGITVIKRKLTFTLSWEVVPGAVIYYYSILKNGIGSNLYPEGDIGTTSTNVSLATSKLEANTSYTVKVIAKNSSGETSSSIVSFLAGENTIAEPIITSPSIGSTINKSNSTFTISWAAVPGAVIYYYSVFKNGAGNNLYPDGYSGTTSTSVSLVTSTLEENTSYTVKVKVVSSTGATNSSSMSFVTGANTITIPTMTDFALSSKAISIGEIVSFSGNINSNAGILEKVTVNIEGPDSEKNAVTYTTQEISGTSYSMSNIASFVSGKTYMIKSGNYKVQVWAKNKNEKDVIVAEQIVTVTQYTSVSGMVINKYNLSEIDHVNIEFGGLTYTTLTDGKFNFTRVMISTHNLEANKVGYYLVDEKGKQQDNIQLNISEAGLSDIKIYMIKDTGYKITGYVKNENGEAIEGAKVFPYGTDSSVERFAVFTDANGRFTMLGVEKGWHELMVTKDGYLSALNTYSIQVPSDEPIELKMNKSLKTIVPSEKYNDYTSYWILKEQYKNEIPKDEVSKANAIKIINTNLSILKKAQLTDKQNKCIDSIITKLSTVNFKLDDLRKVIEFRFEGVGNSDLYKAMSIVIRNGEVYGVFFNTSTIPDHPLQAASGIIKDGVYELVTKNHSNYNKKMPYASLQLRYNSSASLPSIFDMSNNKVGYKSMTTTGVDSHYGYKKSRGSWGCITMPYDDYLAYMKVMGFVEKQKPYKSDYSLDYGLWNKESIHIGKIIIVRCDKIKIKYGKKFMKTR